MMMITDDDDCDDFMFMTTMMGGGHNDNGKIGLLWQSSPQSFQPFTDHDRSILLVSQW